MFAGLSSYKEQEISGYWVDLDAWKQSLYPRSKPDLFGSSKQANFQLAEGRVFISPRSHQKQDIPLEQVGLVVSFWGRLDNRADLLAHKFLNN